jgi:D-lactate dehydrogenase (cytochrome)
MEDGQRLRVEAGATLEEIEAYAASLKCFFPPNPTEGAATIGGIFATGAAGPSSLRYGRSYHYIQALCWLTAEGTLWEIERGHFVFDETGCNLPDGRRLEIQALPAASPLAFGLPYMGLDLIDFLAGSEGKLGIAAELSLALLPLPSQGWGVIYFFSDAEKSFAFGEGLLGRLEQGDAPYLVCAEFMDDGALTRLEPEKLGLPVFPEGAKAAVYTELAGESAEALEAILADHLNLFATLGEPDENTWAEQGQAGIRRFRQLRHAIPALVGEQAGFYDESGRLPPRMETDFSGPPDRAADYIRMYQSELQDTGLAGMVYGHLLQNRLHTAIFCNSPQELEKADALIRQWAQRVVADGGKLVSENGVGRLKTGLLDALMPEDLKLQREAIRHSLAPSSLLE